MNKKFIKISITFIIAMLAIIIFLFSPIFLVRTVIVVNNNIISTEEIENLTNAYKQNLFLVSSKSIQDKTSSIPYVRQIKVKKDYPNTLILDIEEREPVAYIKYTDTELLCIDNEGIVLEAVNSIDRDKNLVTYYGLDFKDFKVGQLLNTENTKIFKYINDLSNYMKSNELSNIVTKVNVADIEDTHVFIYDLDFSLGKENDSFTAIKKISAILDELPNSREIKAKINLDTGIIDLTT